MNFCSNLLKNFIKHKKIYIRSAAIKFIFTAVIFIYAGTTNAATASIDKNFKQVKSSESATVYYIDHAKGMKKAYTSEVAYLAYGNKWSDIKTVEQSALDALPDLSLVKTENDAKIYYIKNGKKAWIQTENEFIKYGFRWSDVANVLPADLNTYQESYLELIYSSDDSQIIASYDSSGAKAITIEVDESSPKGGMIPLNSPKNLIGVFKLSAADDAVEIGELKIKLLGVFNRSLLKNAEIIIGTSLNAKSANSQNGGELKFYFNEPLIIDAGSSKKISLYVDINDSDQDVSHQTIQASILSLTLLNNDEEEIVLSSAKADAHTLVDAKGFLAEIDISEQTSNLNSQELAIGTTDQKIIKFTVKETTASENVLLKKIVLINSGSAGDDDLSNFILRSNDNKNIASAKKMNDRTLVFYLDDYKIKKGGNETFTVTANIDGRDGSMINMQIQEVAGKGEEYGYNASGNIKNTDENIKIVQKSLGIISLDLAPSNGVFSEQSGVLLGVYEIRNNNKIITLESVKVELHKSDSAPSPKGSMVLVDYETGELISSVNIEGNVYEFDISGISISEKGKVRLAIISEIPESAKQGDKYQLAIKEIVYRAQNSTIFFEEANAEGKVLTVSRSNLFIYNDNEAAGTYYTKGQKGVEIAKFYIEASYGDDAKITSLTFAKGNTSGSVSYDNGFSNVRAYIGNKKVGETIIKPFTDTFYFGGFETKLSNSKRYEIRLVADTEIDLNISQTQYRLINMTAVSYASGINTVVAGLNTDSKPSFFGTPKVELTTLSGGQVAIGEKANMVGSFSVANIGDEEVELNYLTLITSNEGFSYTYGYDDLKIIDTETGRALKTISKPTSGANKVSFRGLNLEKGATKKFEIYVDAEKVTSAGEFQLYFAELEAESDSSGIKAQASGCPSQDVKVIVN